MFFCAPFMKKNYSPIFKAFYALFVKCETKEYKIFFYLF